MFGCQNGIGGVVRGNSPDTLSSHQKIYKSEILNPAITQRCDIVTPKSWATSYNLEAIIALAFRLNTYEASRVAKGVGEFKPAKKRTQ